MSKSNLYTWGRNNYGQLGDGTTTNRYSPTLINHPTGDTWISASLGYHHSSSAIDSSGNLYTWGYNKYGQLGDRTTTNRHSPTLIDHPTGDTWISASLGGGHSLALDSSGNLYTWGRNNYGRLGDGTATNRHSPTLIDHPDGDTWISASLGGGHSLALHYNLIKINSINYNIIDG
jgi:alpha-tubulin suppressor-like RCC1 family protein